MSSAAGALDRSAPAAPDARHEIVKVPALVVTPIFPVLAFADTVAVISESSLERPERESDPEA